MATITKNGQIYMVVTGEKLIGGVMVPFDRMMWIGTEKDAATAEAGPAKGRLIGNLIEAEMRVQQ